MKLHKRRPRIVGRGEVAARPLVSRSARSSAAEPADDDDDQDPEMADCMDAADSSVSTRAPGSSSSPCSSMLSPLSGKENAGDDGSTAAAPSRPASAPEAAGAQGQGQQQKPKRQVTLLPSVFEGRPPVILFHYTDACGAKQRPMERAVLADIDGPRIFYSHTDAVHEYNAVVNILRQGGLYRVRPDTQRWLLLWSKHPPPETLRALKPAQKTNHFRGSWHLGRKDLIWKSLSKMQRRFGKSYHITPQAYVLPKAFMSYEAARIRQPNGLWIWKPCSQSCGRGIKVFSSNMSPDEVKELGRKRGVIQRYVPNPLLIFGYKFDLRIYVVVVSYDPLKVYINDEGLVRLATAKYSADPETLEQQTMHLTNYSVNKASPLFVQNRDGKDGAEAVANTDCDDVGPGASKWSLGELRAHFKRQGLDYTAMFDRIKDLVIKTLIAVKAPIQAEWSRALEAPDEEGWSAHGAAGAHRGSCFEMYGFDVLVDTDLKPWLLEVNICPSLSSGSPLDKRIKTKLVADTLTLVGLRPPRALWRKCRGGAKRTSSDVPVAGDEKEGLSGGAGPCASLGAAALQARVAKLAACTSPQEALALFDEAAWEMVLDAHDEDMRCGGLERIHPTADSEKYAQFFGEESYPNLVLRKFYEAGGGELFRTSAGRRLLPPWVPRQICFTPT